MLEEPSLLKRISRSKRSRFVILLVLGLIVAVVGYATILPILSPDVHDSIMKAVIAVVSGIGISVIGALIVLGCQKLYNIYKNGGNAPVPDLQPDALTKLLQKLEPLQLKTLCNRYTISDVTLPNNSSYNLAAKLEAYYMRTNGNNLYRACEQARSDVERYGWASTLSVPDVGPLQLTEPSEGDTQSPSPQRSVTSAAESHISADTGGDVGREREELAAQSQADYIQAYLLRLKEDVNLIEPLGIAEKKVALSLTDIYVPLRAVESNDVSEQSRMVDLIVHRKGNLLSLFSDSPEQQDGTVKVKHLYCLLLLGDTGSGKTIALRYAALQLAEAYLKRDPKMLAIELGLYTPVPFLPIYIRLPKLAIYISEQKHRLARSEHFIEWLDEYAFDTYNVPKGTLATSIKSKDEAVIFLLDGLDEVGDFHHRQFMADTIVKVTKEYPNHRYVLTSRTAVYRSKMVLSGFQERLISRLSIMEAREMSQKWFNSASANPSAADRQQKRLWAVISVSDKLTTMAANPLLLTALALLQFSETTLPTQRNGVYKKLVDLLLKDWRERQINKDVLPSPSSMEHDELPHYRLCLAQLALNMQKQKEQVIEVSLHQAKEYLRPLYKGTAPNKVDGLIEALMESLVENSGIIREQKAMFSFAHPSLQEYMAAEAICEDDNTVRFLLEHSSETRWRETMLLTVGCWYNDKDYAKIRRLVEELITRGSIEEVILAGQSLAEVGEREEFRDLCQIIATRLREPAFTPAICPLAYLRNSAATLLDLLDIDERPGLNFTEASYWSERIEAGQFFMVKDLYARIGKSEGFMLNIKQPYKIARYPVTNGQYLSFLQHLRHESQDGRAELYRPFTWLGDTYNPGERNHPVRGIGWDAAFAFAKWVEELLRSRGQMNVNEEIRLPTEVEWDRAALYPVKLPASDIRQRIYPWDAEMQHPRSPDDVLTFPANINSSRIGGTSVVGVFPNGAAGCGAEDMAGNISEWCTISDEYNLHPDWLMFREEGRTLDDLSIKENRYVLCGGSYLRDAYWCVSHSLMADGEPLSAAGLRLIYVYPAT